MQTFAYSNPASVADAASAAMQEDAKLMAGGQTLLQSMKLGLIAPSAVVDISGIAELKGIGSSGGMSVTGAPLCRVMPFSAYQSSGFITISAGSWLPLRTLDSRMRL